MSEMNALTITFLILGAMALFAVVWEIADTIRNERERVRRYEDGRAALAAEAAVLEGYLRDPDSPERKMRHRLDRIRKALAEPQEDDLWKS